LWSPRRDNYGTHKTPAIQDWLARHPRFQTADEILNSLAGYIYMPKISGAGHY
jgi:hypothetical protein